MTVEITKFVTGPIETNSYVVSNDRKHCLVVDPSSPCDAIINHIKAGSLSVDAIVLTHGHFDHTLGIPDIQSHYPNTPVWMHRDDRILLEKAEYNGAFLIGSDFGYHGPLTDLPEGAAAIGQFSCTVLHVPGHTPGGCALVFENHCLSGDSLFAGSIGRSDFQYSDGDLLMRAIKEKLLSLPDSTIVYPGHGGRTTIGRERRLNPFLHD